MGLVLVSGEWRPIAEAKRLLKSATRIRARQYTRDSDGQFASTGGVDNGGDFEDDPYVGELDEGDYGYGRDPSGESYTEYDVDTETGEPKFSPAYRETYGPLVSDNRYEGAGISVAEGTKRGVHIADDSQGTLNRRVVQELTTKEARVVSDGVYSVYSGERESFTGAGVTVTPAGRNPTQDGVRVKWADGTESHFDGESGEDEAFQLQEILQE